MTRPSPTALMWLSGVMFCATVAGIVTLTLAGAETDALESLAKPLLTGLVLSGLVAGMTRGQDERLDKQDRTLAQITKQTNGVLNQRIYDGTRKAVRDLVAEGELARPEDRGA